MAMTFAGLVRWAPGVPTTVDTEEMRRTGAPPAALLAKVRGLPKNLPPTARLIASHQIANDDLISVMLVEVETVADLRAITAYYAGWFQIAWNPTNVVERD